VLLRKLAFLDAGNAERRLVASRYSEAFAGVGDLELPPVPAGSAPVWHLFVVRTGDPAELAAFLAERRIATARHYPDPVHLVPAYARLGYERGDFPRAEAHARRVFSLPLFPGMTEAQVDAVVSAVRGFFDGPVLT